VVGDARAAAELRGGLSSRRLKTRVLHGAEALKEVASLPETTQVMCGIVGAAGLLPALAAVRAGKQLLLANKEPLVMAGGLFMREVARCGATLMPVDSEHNAIFQCLPTGYRCGETPPGVKRIILTASGGPCRDMALEQLADVTPEQALRHPNWVMGRKISVDSATMMNKGLELIEASWLFGLEPARIDVVLHPQSVVHSLVEYADGSQLAQLGEPDMRTPIASALAWPERIESGVTSLDLTSVGRLDFDTLDDARYPCMRLARQSAETGDFAPVVLNAANEVAVAAFLAGHIRFTGIAEVIDRCLQQLGTIPAVSEDELEGILAVDAWTRQQAEGAVALVARRSA
jgi:1-deoxy-D-xylulose-5-phosphate reductoisomerase